MTFQQPRMQQLVFLKEINHLIKCCGHIGSFTLETDCNQPRLCVSAKTYNLYLALVDLQCDQMMD